MEVWDAAIACPNNGITQIYYSETKLPAPGLGFFARMIRNGEGDTAEIFTHRPHPSSQKRRLSQHWKEFVIIKELMHCWSPRLTYVGDPSAAADLLTDLNTLSPVGAVAISDLGALLAAAEVIMPCWLIKEMIAKGKTVPQIAAEQGLHPDVMAAICRHDLMEQRLTGSL